MPDDMDMQDPQDNEVDDPAGPSGSGSPSGGSGLARYKPWMQALGGLAGGMGGQQRPGQQPGGPQSGANQLGSGLGSLAGALMRPQAQGGATPGGAQPFSGVGMGPGITTGPNPMPDPGLGGAASGLPGLGDMGGSAASMGNLPAGAADIAMADGGAVQGGWGGPQQGQMNTMQMRQGPMQGQSANSQARPIGGQQSQFQRYSPMQQQGGGPGMFAQGPGVAGGFNGGFGPRGGFTPQQGMYNGGGMQGGPMAMIQNPYQQQRDMQEMQNSPMGRMQAASNMVGPQMLGQSGSLNAGMMAQSGLGPMQGGPMAGSAGPGQMMSQGPPQGGPAQGPAQQAAPVQAGPDLWAQTMQRPPQGMKDGGMVKPSRYCAMADGGAVAPAKGGGQNQGLQALEVENAIQNHQAPAQLAKGGVVLGPQEPSQLPGLPGEQITEPGQAMRRYSPISPAGPKAQFSPSPEGMAHHLPTKLRLSKRVNVKLPRPTMKGLGGVSMK